MEENKSKPLHLSMRPSSFAEVHGQKSAVNSLERDLKKGKFKSFLLSGETGCGKTTIAYLIANYVNGELIELNVSNARGIDDAREIINSSKYKSFNGKAKVFVLDECHMSTTPYQNALLKILEAPPEGVYFVLCTTDPAKLLRTVKNRCRQIKLTSFNDNTMNNFLKSIIDRNSYKVSEAIIAKIVKLCSGIPRQALVSLGSVVNLDTEREQLQAINSQAGNSDKINAIELCRALLKGSRWDIVSSILKNIDGEAEGIRYMVLSYMNKVLLSSGNKKAYIIIDSFSESFIYNKQAGLTAACYRAVNTEVV